MAQHLDQTPQAAIAGIVGSLLALHGITTAVAADAPLADAGLSSMDMMNLMLGVEAKFGLIIPQRNLTPENFRTINAIAELLAKLRQAA